MKEGDNFLTVEVNNRRIKDAIPALSFDWWNYGGITRDVLLVTTPQTYIEEYVVQLDKEQPDRLITKVRLSEQKPRLKKGFGNHSRVENHIRVVYRFGRKERKL